MSPAEEDGGGYGAFTLPCRRSHCLSEGLAGLSIPPAPRPAFQGRRAQTTQVGTSLLFNSDLFLNWNFSTKTSEVVDKSERENGRGIHLE